MKTIDRWHGSFFARPFAIRGNSSGHSGVLKMGGLWSRSDDISTEEGKESSGGNFCRESFMMSSAGKALDLERSGMIA